MNFDSSMRARWRDEDGGWQFEIPAGWLQGRAVFGGLVAAAATGLAIRNLSEEWTLRSLSTQFLRPTQLGALRGKFAINRQGRSVTFAEVRLSQDAGDVLIVNLVFAKPRDGSIAIEAPKWKLEVDPDVLTELPFIAGVVPEFVSKLSLRWADGGFPFSSQQRPSLTGLCRFKVPARDIECILGLLDAWPCPSLSMLSAPAAASSVSWSAHIIEVPPDCDGWFSFRYDTIAGNAGFHTVVGSLHGPDGQLVGWTEQLVALFD